MKNLKKTLVKTIFALSFCFSVSTMFAHPGGHYHAGDKLNSWTFANGQTICGNFSQGNGDKLVLEQLGGKLITISVNSLTAQDQLLARFKIKKFERLNEQFLTVPATVSKTVWIKNPQYLLITICLGFLLWLVFANVNLLFKNNNTYTNKTWRLAFSAIAAVCLLVACKKSSDATTPVTTTTPIATTPIDRTRTTFLDSAFDPYRPAVTTVSTGATYYTVGSLGIPAHNMMVGITSWQQQVPVPQTYTGTNSWSIPLQPVYAAIPKSTKANFLKGAIAIAVNGVPIFNALNNRGEDAFLFGELDNWGGHCGKADDYHYHTAPLHLSTTSLLRPIAFALDGFAVYGTKEPDGVAMNALDTCHGHIYNGGTYHYHGTTNYPYLIGSMKGVVNTDPNTPAPENQILPQGFASPLRPALTPLAGATITAFTHPTAMSYSLQYKVGANFGYVNYNWNAANLYFFTFINTAGVTTTAQYQR